MSEIGIGVLFAAWFVTFYLLVAKLFGPRRERAMALWRHWSHPRFDAAQLADGRRPQLFLTTESLSQHHSQAKTVKPAGQQQRRPPSDGERRQ